MKFFALVVLFFRTVLSLWGQSISSGLSYDNAFQAGKWEISTGGAVLFSPYVATRNRPTHDYALAVINAGYMLSDIKEWGAARGNFECLAELFAGPVFVGRGNYVSGITFWGRYNLVQPGWRWIPFAQMGLGAGGTDIDQSVIGQVFQFNLNVAFGLRYFIRPDFAFVGEYRYQHISNANTGTSNIGINAQGTFLGVAWMF